MPQLLTNVRVSLWTEEPLACKYEFFSLRLYMCSGFWLKVITHWWLRSNKDVSGTIHSLSGSSGKFGRLEVQETWTLEDSVKFSESNTEGKNPGLLLLSRHRGARCTLCKSVTSCYRSSGVKVFWTHMDLLLLKGIKSEETLAGADWDQVSQNASPDGAKREILIIVSGMLRCSGPRDTKRKRKEANESSSGL